MSRDITAAVRDELARQMQRGFGTTALVLSLVRFRAWAATGNMPPGVDFLDAGLLLEKLEATEAELIRIKADNEHLRTEKAVAWGKALEPDWTVPLGPGRFELVHDPMRRAWWTRRGVVAAVLIAGVFIVYAIAMVLT